MRNDDRELTARVRDESPTDDTPGAAAGVGGAEPLDAGRTSGGGSLGHKQPPDVAAATGIRNHPADHRQGGDTTPRD